MVFKLGIPVEHLDIIKKILSLSEEKKTQLHNKFKTYKPSKYGESIQAIEDFKDSPEIFELIIIFYRLYHNLMEDQIIGDIDDFISHLTNSFVAQTESEYKDNEIQSLKKFLKEILTIDTPFYFFDKAIKLLIERSKLIENFRIITDIRPVFKDQEIDSPNYCVITHNLRILYTKEFRNKKKVFFALDHQDLIELKSQIERALEKENELQKLCQKMGLEIFEV